MAMSKKDYQAIARAIYETRAAYGIAAGKQADGTTGGALEMVTVELCMILSADNPRFDRARFIEACETGRCKGMKAATSAAPVVNA